MSTATPTASVDAPSLLRSAGLKVTDTRCAVVATLAAHPHARADAVFSHVERDLPTTSRQAVYNVLGDLTSAGLARRIEPAGQPGLYELRVGDNHHHIVCQRCGAVADVDCVTGHAPCLTPDQTNGFTLAEAEVTFWGVCEACQAAASSVTPDHQLKEHTHD